MSACSRSVMQNFVAYAMFCLLAFFVGPWISNPFDCAMCPFGVFWGLFVLSIGKFDRILIVSFASNLEVFPLNVVLWSAETLDVEKDKR